MNSPAQMKAELAAVIRAYHAKGWSPATSTNYSFRLANDPTTIYVSRSGIDKSQFSESDFMEVDLQGLPKSGFENIKPSAETLIHCALYTLPCNELYSSQSFSLFSFTFSYSTNTGVVGRIRSIKRLRRN